MAINLEHVSYSMNEIIPPLPVARRLRILAFDPSLATRLDTSVLNEITVEIPWEPLQPGPIGEYLEVVDVDPASGAFYQPVDLNHHYLLAQDGWAPSESNPQFHQQMVYAVAMNTIRHFERALGRVALWADRRIKLPDGNYARQFVRRLRLYPHALRDRNAYYSPAKKAVLFGYFPVTARDADNTPGTVVHTCLSHDIVAHEVTHALLDGVHPRFNEPTNPDVLAFHEAFADIVALFQHFAYPGVLESQITHTRGDLHKEHLLSQLAQQFGKATGRGGALRNALWEKNEQTQKMEPRKPNPRALDGVFEAHERGGILVAAVFRAFLLMYRSRTADLYRIATQGTGNLPEGDIHPDLTRRLAAEAASCAERVLQMCIRAIDYCPPVDITFGDFLRGIVTADVDYSPADKSGYRIVFIESFREWGIYPRGTRSMGLDALVWPTGADVLADETKQLMERQEQERLGYVSSKSKRKNVPNYQLHSQEDLQNDLTVFVKSAMSNWTLSSNRREVWDSLENVRGVVWNWLARGDSIGKDYARVMGLAVSHSETSSTVFRSQNTNEPALEIHSSRPALRRTIDGNIRTDLVIEVTQRRRGYFQPEVQQAMDALPFQGPFNEPDFIYRAGCTILIDPKTSEVRRVIRTASTIDDDDGLDRVRDYLLGKNSHAGNAFNAGHHGTVRQRERQRDEPFALLHRQGED
jgi:hypothetical protein